MSPGWGWHRYIRRDLSADPGGASRQRVDGDHHAYVSEFATPSVVMLPDLMDDAPLHSSRAGYDSGAMPPRASRFATADCSKRAKERHSLSNFTSRRHNVKNNAIMYRCQ